MNPKISDNLWRVFKILLAITFVAAILLFFLLSNSDIAIALWPYIQKVDPCYIPPGVAVDSAAIANVLTFEDLNSNGIQDNDEPPLSGVMVAIDASGVEYTERIFENMGSNSESVMTTDKDGRAHLYQFMAGFSCNNSIKVRVFAQTPKGYRATTPTTLDVTNQEVYKFGFIRNP